MMVAVGLAVMVSASPAAAAAPSCMINSGDDSEVSHGGLLASCSDPDGDTPSYTFTQQGTLGTASVQQPGSRRVAYGPHA
jgi:hypothetical protein